MADLYCGAGGTSEGARRTGAVRIVCGVNHWKVAVQTHSANFPDALHINSRIDLANPSECPKIDILTASPECTHHSDARGGKPTSDQQRAGAWDIMKWIEHHRPQWIVIENVRAFRNWGPVGRDGKPLKSGKGKIFDAWLMAIRAMGYKVDHQILNAADHGAATSRPRLFVIARKGNRDPIFPEPTHGRFINGMLPGMKLLPWRSAFEIVDWSIPCPSVFGRPNPLKEKTLMRIGVGIERFVGPFAMDVNHGNGAGSDPYRMRPLDKPLNTITSKRGLGLAIPFQYQLIGRGAGRSKGIETPVPTIIAHRNTHGIAIPYLSILRNNQTVMSMDQPVSTITTSGAHHCVVVPILHTYYGTQQRTTLEDPLPTITTNDRFALVHAIVVGAREVKASTPDEAKLLELMKKFGVHDVGFRMFENHELAAAQGFGSEYLFFGTVDQITRQIGNSVPPDMACGIFSAIAAA